MEVGVEVFSSASRKKQGKAQHTLLALAVLTGLLCFCCFFKVSLCVCVCVSHSVVSHSL